MSMRFDPIRLSVATLSGALLALLSAPMNLAAVHWIAYLPMFWVLRADTPRQNRWYALAYGTAAVGTIFRWVPHSIIHFSNIPTAGAYGLLVLFSLAFGLAYVALWAAVHPLRARFGTAWILALPAWQIVIEYVSMFITLFPYSQGVSQYQQMPIFQLASVTGVWGVSFLLFFVNSALAEWMYRRREGREPPVLWISAAFSTVFVVVIWGALRVERIEAILREAPVLRVAQLQTDTTMAHRMSTARQRTFYDWVNATKKIAPGSADLVVWSEGASPFNPTDDNVKTLLGNLARKGNFELLLGGGTITWTKDANGESDYEAYNSVYLFGRDGEIKGRYDKNVPLPFGEYLPLSGIFPILNEWIEGPGNFRAGTGTETLPGEYNYAAPICYEAILPYVCRRYDNPDVLVNVTNDAWFGEGPATFQHGMLATIRATELGRPFIRAAYTGSSLVVSPHGHVHHQTGSFETVNRVVPLRMATVDTLYGRFGDWFVWLCGLGLLAGGLATRSGTTKP